MEFAAIMTDHIVPPYQALMESYDKVQGVQKSGRETKLNTLEAPSEAIMRFAGQAQLSVHTYSINIQPLSASCY